MLGDRRLKVREIVETIGMFNNWMVSILNNHLGMRKLSARWVPRLLTIHHKRNCAITSTKSLAFLNRDLTRFCVFWYSRTNYGFTTAHWKRTSTRQSEFFRALQLRWRLRYRPHLGLHRLSWWWSFILHALQFTSVIFKRKNNQWPMLWQVNAPVKRRFG